MSHPQEKLTAEQVAEIKYHQKEPYWGQTKRLAEKYGVSTSLISAIKVGKQRKNVPCKALRT